MSNIYRLNIDPLDSWLEPESKDELHSRIFTMTDISCKALQWEQGDQEFFECYNKFLSIAEKARPYNEHLVLMSLLILKELVEDCGITFEHKFDGMDNVENHLREVIKKLCVVLEHLMFTKNVAKTREDLEKLPKGMRTVSFDFIMESHTGADNKDNEYYPTLEDLIDPKQFNTTYAGYDEDEEDFEEIWDDMFGSDNNKGE